VKSCIEPATNHILTHKADEGEPCANPEVGTQVDVDVEPGEEKDLRPDCNSVTNYDVDKGFD